MNGQFNLSAENAKLLNALAANPSAALEQIVGMYQRDLTENGYTELDSVYMAYLVQLSGNKDSEAIKNKFCFINKIVDVYKMEAKKVVQCLNALQNLDKAGFDATLSVKQ